jgi:hypothetical protein
MKLTREEELKNNFAGNYGQGGMGEYGGYNENPGGFDLN